MKVVLDTNVFVSGVFFGGPPYAILDAERKGRFRLVLSPDILAEYYRVGADLSQLFPQVDLDPPPLPAPVSDDPDDDKFLACALAAGCKYIVSGDRHLLRISGYRGISVLRPSQFLDDCVIR